jgi:hypothetical protein
MSLHKYKNILVTNYINMLDKLSMRVLGGILFVTGVIIIFAINKKRFNRRSITGMETFNSYENSLRTRGSEGCIKVIAWVFVLGGGSMFLLSFE